MLFLVVIVIGIVQGLGEFLPISSSGHLVMFYNIFNITENTIFLSVILHLATLFAVIFVYYKDIVELIKHPFCKTNKLLVVATIPTVILVLIFESLLDKVFSGNFYIYGFLITAAILIASELMSRKQNQGYKSDILNLDLTFKKAIIIGIAQGVACVPGVSRSGSTISTALMLKVNKEDATKFSFLMSIPIIIASFLYELLKIKDATFTFSSIQLFLGFLFAFVFGIIAVKFMIKFVKQQKLYIFSIYLVILSVFLLLNEYVLNLF